MRNITYQDIRDGVYPDVFTNEYAIAISKIFNFEPYRLYQVTANSNSTTTTSVNKISNNVVIYLGNITTLDSMLETNLYSKVYLKKELLLDPSIDLSLSLIDKYESMIIEDVEFMESVITYCITNKISLKLSNDVRKIAEATLNRNHRL